MPWTILEKLWEHAQNPTSTTTSAEDNNWNKQIEILYRMGISMEDALQYLYFERPDFEAFKSWIESRKQDVIAPQENSIGNVLSAEDLAFWGTNGYVIVREAISKQDCEATQHAIWEYLEMDPDKKETWYKGHHNQKGLMLSFSDHETLNQNRFSPRIRKAYEQLYQTTKIYKTIDKVSFNPPETKDFRFMGGALHWDVSLKQPIPFGLQGLLYLTDCGANDGAFHCVPGFHNRIDSWLDEVLPDEKPREKALANLQPLPVIANAGDFIIWQNTLPHCATPNHGTKPRMVQYLTYLPEDYQSAEEWL